MTSMTIKRHITKISQNLRVNAAGGTIMDNTYAYDAVSNVLSVANGASLPQSGKAGGQMRPVLLAPIQVQTARRLATPLRWAMTTCTASPRRGSI